MYKTLTIAALLLLPALASADPIEDLARHTGMSERNVLMILGPHTPYANYRCCYQAKLRQFKKAVGEDNYDKLMNGENIVLERKLPAEQEQRPIAKAEARKP